MQEENINHLCIAFASSDNVLLDEHFGSCTKLNIYSLSPDSSKHIKTVSFIATTGHNQQKISERLRALEGCFAVYCLACGNPVRKQLLAQGTRVIINTEPLLISTLISHIQHHWPGKIAQRQQRQLNKKQNNDYLNDLSDSEWE